MAKKDDNEAKRIQLLKLELDEAEYKEVEKEKKVIAEEIDRNKKYLIEEVLEEGKTLLNEIEQREKKTFWDKLMDFIFK